VAGHNDKLLGVRGQAIDIYFFKMDERQKRYKKAKARLELELMLRKRQRRRGWAVVRSFLRLQSTVQVRSTVDQSSTPQPQETPVSISLSMYGALVRAETDVPCVDASRDHKYV
jgi:hypothetical protein